MMKDCDKKMICSIKELRDYIYSDAYRISGGVKNIYALYLFNIAFRYIVWMRICTYLYSVHSKTFLRICNYKLKRLMYKSGIQIPYCTTIGKGFYIGHFGNIVVNGNSTIGNNCNISQGVTIGQVNRGKNRGVPIIGNEVYIGPGAKIIGGIKIGNKVCIGANAVVTKDIPDNAVVVGVPGKIISYDGSIAYINRKIE